MRFLIITHVVHKLIGDKFYAYGPYVKEMNLWFKHVDEVALVAPLSVVMPQDSIDLAYNHKKIDFKQVPEFDFLSWKTRIKTVFSLPRIFFKVFSEMRKADHIHLRCPGNMGLIGVFAQLFFPKKTKTSKYAGNWDPESPQPITYKWQQKLLSNEFLTRNMKVMVYGNWKSSSKNLVSFFTASYSNKDKKSIQPRALNSLNPIQLLFVGSLHQGKNPIVSCQVAKLLFKKGKNVELHLFGEGEERKSIHDFIEKENLSQIIFLHGNVDSSRLKEAYQAAHFLIFASESEGWPKVVAESMFWACLPVTTPVSCVPQMIGKGSRGELVSKDVNEIVDRVISLLNNPSEYYRKCCEARDWSQLYTLEKFEAEIKNLLKN